MNTTTSQPNGIAAIDFSPLLAPNAIFLSFYSIFLLLHVLIAIRFWRFYGYSIGMVCGILLELIGYCGKVQLSHNRDNKDGYIMYTLSHLFVIVLMGMSSNGYEQVYHRPHTWPDISIICPLSQHQHTTATLLIISVHAHQPSPFRVPIYSRRFHMSLLHRVRWLSCGYIRRESYRCKPHDHRLSCSGPVHSHLLSRTLGHLPSCLAWHSSREEASLRYR